MRVFYFLFLCLAASRVYGTQNEDSTVVIDQADHQQVVEQADICDLTFYNECFSNDCRRLVWVPFLEYVGGHGLSYEKGYQTVGSFCASLTDSCYGFPFLDAELHRVDEGKAAANIGLGWRVVVSDRNEILGANVFLDVRHIRQKDFAQIGVGAEFLGAIWDFRINGYIPFVNREAVIETTRFNFSDDLFAIRKESRLAMWGVDTEVGGCILNCGCLSVYAAAGPYFYHSKCCNTLIGGRGRLDIKFTPYITFEFQVTHDTYFETNVQGQVRFSLLFPSMIDCFKCFFVPVRRNPIIVLEDLCLWDADF